MVEIAGRSHSTVDQIKQEFRSHLLSVEYGSPGYLAFCDYYALENEKYTQRISLRELSRNPNIENRIAKESELRVTETKIALIEHAIDRGRITNIDYSKAYDQVEKTMIKLREAMGLEWREQHNEHSNDEWIRTRINDDFHDAMVTDFKDVLNRHYE